MKLFDFIEKSTSPHTQKNAVATVKEQLRFFLGMRRLLGRELKSQKNISC